ncbi:beta-ketoacyl-[acyl-carrier-protein] synthase family protein [Streptomyces sp. RS2]|uniref:beta-ketoacyl-[acyl-carrier-protein] synthase family protein n=1 Tax=Streptomyces sp. RS2 TaxID=1451205 RepID=UPI0021F8D4CE|nr:beta-ketoacyl-[acyl-carrier-protein] synthase family protein [Streptomyces sp. RS2]MCW1099211.1 beta-ketoacyl-[acyl-carrier-protein] synthase family protein [Streptomyces sp. RS2]
MNTDDGRRPRPEHRVVITGTGAVTPLGEGVAALHQRAVKGESGLADGEGRCREFDPHAVLSRKEIHGTDRFSQLALVAAEEATRQAGWADGLPYAPERVMCVIGSVTGGVLTFEEQLTALRRNGADAVSRQTMPMIAPHAAAVQIAVRHRLRGETYCLTSGCASGTQAIGSGVRAIRSGSADAVVVGGAEAPLTNFVRAAYLKAGFMSPTGISVPFDEGRDGFLMGEGAGVLVLESERSAERRRQPVLGEVLGYGASSDAFHVLSSAEDGVAAMDAIRRALADAGVTPDGLSYLNAHATGSARDDRLEVAALRGVLTDALETLPMSSTKSVTGHLMGAAGAVEAIATLMALNDGVAPPTVGLRRPDAELGTLRHVLHATPLRTLPGRRAVGISTTFGFGGHNAVLVLGSAAGTG